MNSHAIMYAHFEREKNLKALAYTIVICGALFFLFFFLQWTLPQIPPPVVDDGIEVNLGNSETGLGDIAPQLPGTPSNAAETNVTPPPTSAAVVPKQNINAQENGDEEINNSTKIIKPVIKSKPINDNLVIKKHTENTVAAPAPKPAVAKALYKGGVTNGNGGNNADSYNGIKNQGIAGGKGDQGNPNGNPNSDSYTGNGGTGKSGVTIRSGLDGRRFTQYPSFKDEFNENAKVAVDITVNASGYVTATSINPRGTTTTNPTIRSIALQKAKLLKLNAGNTDEQNGTIVFNFKVTN